MDATQRANVGIRTLIEAGVIPEYDSQENYTRNWTAVATLLSRTGDADTAAELARLRAENERLIAAWPERERPRLCQSLILPASTDPRGREMYGERWPEAKRQFVRMEVGLDAPDADEPHADGYEELVD